MEIRITLITGFFTLSGTLLGIYISYKLQSSQSKRAKKILLIGELEGLRVLRSQLYRSRFEAEIYSDYYDYRFLITKNSVDFNEARRLGQAAEKLTLELAKSNQQFLEKLGHVSLLFNQTDEIKIIIDENKQFKSPCLSSRPNDKMDIDGLNEWKDKMLSSLQIIIKDEYDNKPREMLNKLSGQLNSTQKKTMIFWNKYMGTDIH